MAIIFTERINPANFTTANYYQYCGRYSTTLEKKIGNRGVAKKAPEIRQELVSGDEQATDSYSPAHNSFASTPSNTTRSQSIDSSTSATTDSQSPVDRIDYEQFDQPAVSAQDSPCSHFIQCESNQRDQELPTWMQSRQSHHQQNIHSLLSLICAVGAIPKIMLQRALCPQKRWNEYGVEYQINPRNAHPKPHLRVLFLDCDRLWQVLQHLVLIAAIDVEKSNNIKKVYFYSSTSAKHLNSRERTY
ncbi:hypothetical protein AOQ84DRAFT_359559 [Glonium stellatum]|uniref:Uncharacterized protein n=1 Tax=Glonium stellatum TaxID=574774 RepID=A0A8E2FAZ6_9PEZI|nr:hypothetical protein AOQ84DRAFT_359559 [Glonium stellatum]